MDKGLENRIKQDWLSWEEKPWYCPECDVLLNMKVSRSCSGGGQFMPPGSGGHHETIDADRPVTFEEFCVIEYRWFSI